MYPDGISPPRNTPVNPKVFPDTPDSLSEGSPQKLSTSSLRPSIGFVGTETLRSNCVNLLGRIASAGLNFCRNARFSGRPKISPFHLPPDSVPKVSRVVYKLLHTLNNPEGEPTPASIESDFSGGPVGESTDLEMQEQTVKKIELFIRQLSDNAFFSVTTNEGSESKEVVIGRQGKEYKVEKVDGTVEGGLAKVALTNNLAVRRLKESKSAYRKKFREEIAVEREILNILGRRDELGELRQTYLLEKGEVQNYRYPAIVSNRFDRDCRSVTSFPNEQIPQMVRSIVQEFIILLKNGVVPTDLKTENISYRATGETHLQDLGGSEIVGGKIGSVTLSETRLFTYTKGLASEKYFSLASEAKKNRRTLSYESNLKKGALCALGEALVEIWGKRSDRKEMIFNREQMQFINEMIDNPGKYIDDMIGHLQRNFLEPPAPPKKRR